MNQQGREWHEWRRQGIGSSQVASIMGCGKYRTELELYEEKISPIPEEEKSSYILEKGKRSEPKARAMFEFMRGIEFPPALVVMDGYPFMRASLDGWNKEFNQIVEFKYVGRDKGMIPDHHRAQIQYQLLITGAQVCWYQAYDFKDEVVTLHPLIQELPAANYQAVMFEKCKFFWRRVLERNPPPAKDEDFKPLKHPDLPKFLQKWKQLGVQIDELQKERDNIEQWAKGLVTEPRMWADGIQFIRQTRRGGIDYDKIPQLDGVDLEPYRKPDSKEFVTMKPIGRNRK